jgi:adenylylsulfate kinase
MKTGVFIGRFQPFHGGHVQCIERILSECDVCIVIVRDGAKGEQNPYDYHERLMMIRQAFPDAKRVWVQAIADPGFDLTVYRGRDVGWKLEDIRLPPEVEAISATKLRNE